MLMSAMQIILPAYLSLSGIKMRNAPSSDYLTAHMNTKPHRWYESVREYDALLVIFSMKIGAL